MSRFRPHWALRLAPHVGWRVLVLIGVLALGVLGLTLGDAPRALAIAFPSVLGLAGLVWIIVSVAPIRERQIASSRRRGGTRGR
ncbi:hypothetical protein [Actinoplanes utahensis]|uniref:Uncharacterized protein n=1 Tax=Actinoplanes utahensis TaxID=1869 RepID=A0A0A6WXR1_ACTUT|nr:hypothetical protein [Actinoplanes utahensis]KHD72487.1 hypothetical protein MB27_39205 [Actinoplanes utahensis]GIF29405.1 hypothetical protein Aut01nite_23910 [Actinoplanes utahensis]